MATHASTGVWTERAAVTGRLALNALRYIDISAAIIEQAKEPGFTEAGWDELGGLLDTGSFQRKSKDRDPIGWEDYRPILTNWALRTDFRYRFKRLTLAGNLVFLELEEHATPLGGTASVDHTMTVFEFDAIGRIVAVEVYFMIR